MDDGWNPQSGDVVVRKRVREPSKAAPRYDVAIVDRPNQFCEDTYERALNTADRFARLALVDLWYTDDGELFRPITRRRQETSR